MPQRGGFGFGPFRLDVSAKRVLRDGEAIAVPARLYAMLLELAEHAGEVVTKRRLLDVGWPDVTVSENNLVHAIKQLRLLLDATHPDRYVETVSRKGYRFVAPISRLDVLPTDDELDRLMEPHLAFIDGRAALLSLGRDNIRRALDEFRGLVEMDPRRAISHVGLANAAALTHESTRAEAVRDPLMLELADTHAREARRLDPELGEAWITHGFVLSLLGDARRAVAAFRKGVELDPLAVRHHVRFAFGTWGDDRIAAALEALRLQPRLPHAHLLISMVFVARDNIDRAEAELEPGLDGMPDLSSRSSEAPPAGLHWLKSLLRQARNSSDEALVSLRRELDLEACGHLYSRECCASAWYLHGAIHADRNDTSAAVAAYGETIARVPNHPMAQAGLRVIQGLNGLTAEGLLATVDVRRPESITVDRAMAYAVLLKHLKRIDLAADLVCRALEAAPPGNAGWLLPVDPSLGVQHNKEPWKRALEVLDRRAGNWLARLA